MGLPAPPPYYATTRYEAILRAVGVIPEVSHQTLAWNSATTDVFDPIVEGHTYMILFEETIANDAALTIVVQKKGDAAQQVAQYIDTTFGATPVPADIEILASVQLALVGDQYLNTNPYIKVKPGSAPIQLEAVFTPGVGQAAGSVEIYLVDWGTWLT